MKKSMLREIEFLTMKETASILNIGLSTLYRLSQTNEIKVCRFAKNTIRIPTGEIKKYIDKKKGGKSKL